MSDLIIGKDFLVSYPVLALSQNLRFSRETTLTHDGFVCVDIPSGKALALYTDSDLANRYLDACDRSATDVLVKLLNSEALLTVLKLAKANGVNKVIFDPPQQMLARTLRTFCVEAVIKAVIRNSD